jgi:hypothetical protein
METARKSSLRTVLTARSEQATVPAWMQRCNGAKETAGPGARQQAWPLPNEAAVVAYASKRRVQKANRDAMAAELGMSVAALSYWCAPARVRGTLVH